MEKQFKTMLAHPAGKREINFENGLVMIQPKLDGVRCYITKDGMFSRNHNRFVSCPHIEEQYKKFFKKYPDVVLDGELYNHELKNDFNTIISLVRKTKPTDADLLSSRALVQFHNYDMFDYQDPYADYAMRMISLNNIFEVNDLPYSRAVSTSFIQNIEEAKLHHEVFLAEGYEGSIVRLNGAYEQKRSYNLQKFKDFHDKEAVVIDYVQGQGKRSFGIGKFICRDENGIEFGVPVMETNSVLEKMWINRDKYLGKMITFTYFQRTKRGSYRHPLFKAVRNYE